MRISLLSHCVRFGWLRITNEELLCSLCSSNAFVSGAATKVLIDFKSCLLVTLNVGTSIIIQDGSSQLISIMITFENAAACIPLHNAAQWIKYMTHWGSNLSRARCRSYISFQRFLTSMIRILNQLFYLMQFLQNLRTNGAYFGIIKDTCAQTLKPKIVVCLTV